MSTRNIVEPVYIDVCDLCGMSSTNRPKPIAWVPIVVYIGLGDHGIMLDACGECWARDKALGSLRAAAEEIARRRGILIDTAKGGEQPWAKEPK